MYGIYQKLEIKADQRLSHFLNVRAIQYFTFCILFSLFLFWVSRSIFIFSLILFAIEPGNQLNGMCALTLPVDHVLFVVLCLAIIKNSNHCVKNAYTTYKNHKSLEVVADALSPTVEHLIFRQYIQTSHVCLNIQLNYLYQYLYMYVCMYVYILFTHVHKQNVRARNLNRIELEIGNENENENDNVATRTGARSNQN